MIASGQSIAGYIRVSSDKQDTARQRESVEATAKRLGLRIDHLYEDSEGHNARDMAHKRKEFQRMLSAVRAGQISTIIIDSQDRFGTRDSYQWGHFINELREHGCSLLDAAGRNLTSADDATILTSTIGALTSTREQKEKARRCIGGQVEHAKKGHYVGGNPPFGLDVVCFGSDGKEKWRTVYAGHYDRWKVYPDRKREHFEGKDNSPQKDRADVFYYRPSIETERLQIVKQIFSWYASEAISPGQIAARLNELKVDPVFGQHWPKIKLHQMLRNPVYIGRPAWNKRAGSRFVEFVGGQIQEIAGGIGIKGGRSRSAEDFISLDEQQFDPIVDQVTWETVQAKLAAASSEQKPKRKSQTAELWLRPFLVCGHCEKPMRATHGNPKDRVRPSYYCATYGTFGAKNPTGCHCHRVAHKLIEEIVTSYIDEYSTSANDLLAAARGCTSEAAWLAIMEQITDASNERFGLWEEAWEFLEKHSAGLTRADRLHQEYGEALSRKRPKAERAIADKRAELDRMIDDFRDLSPKLRERANAKMESVQAEIDELERESRDLRPLLEDADKELEARLNGARRATETLSNGSAGRQKTEIVSKVIERIICYFRHNSTRTGKNNGRSTLERVVIIPVSGETVTCFTDGIPPERD
jgi:DNA invertase Pin-like site-specific DNA recombinase/predicted  nucleic acid-binding Zn-ribbon protein